MKKTCLITGAASGIGAATADLFREKGWRTALVDVQAVSPAGGDALVIQQDLAQPGAAQRVMDRLSQWSGRLDALVNNAAIQVTKSLGGISAGDWARSMDCNAGFALFAAQAGRELLGKAQGAIVNVASVHALATSPGLPVYAASKGALVALTRSLALELGPLGIRVNAVLPGAVDTPMLRDGLRREHMGGGRQGDALDRLKARHALGRIGLPGDIAQAVYFLADPALSGFITGQSLVVDGGALARLSTE